jgi:exopolysaccharide biosynthesis polyprenyl glycosylphosphotransferase
VPSQPARQSSRVAQLLVLVQCGRVQGGEETLGQAGVRRRFTRAQAGPIASTYPVPGLPLTHDRALQAGGAIPAGPSIEALRRDALYRRSLAAADVAAAAFAVAVTFAGLADDDLKLALLAALPLVVLVSKIIGLYDRDQHLIRRTTLDEVPKLFQVATLYVLVIWLTGALFVTGTLGRGQGLALWALLFVSMAAFRVGTRFLVRARTATERCLVVGDVEAASRLGVKLSTGRGLKAETVGSVPFRERRRRPRNGRLGTIERMGLIVAEHSVERVIIVPGPSDSEAEILHCIRLVKALGVKVSVLPRLFEVVGSSVEFDDVEGVTLLGVRAWGLSTSSNFLKRSMDMAVAGCVLLVLAPLMGLIGLAVKLTSRGPAFFRQPRIGRNGDVFSMYKFRTMVDGAETLKAQLADQNEADGLFKIEDDPRITPLGRFLRRTSLDELPQLVNVLKGEMSLVGPRPLVADEDSKISGFDRWRLRVRPGITGFWQILGPSRVPLHEMVKIDYMYGANWSLWEDIKIILRTIPYMLGRSGM